MAKAKAPATSKASQKNAAKKNPNRWHLSNWQGGPVTLFQALGIRKGKVELPSLQPEMTLGGIQSNTDALAGTSGQSGGIFGTIAGAGKGDSGGQQAANPGNISGGQDGAMKALLGVLGAPLSQANINSLNRWYAHENSSWPPGVQNNPWNTTLGAPGATNWPGNSIGIKQYVTLSQGIQMNAQTLLNWYPGIVTALRSGNGLCGQNLGSEFLRWSGGGYSGVC